MPTAAITESSENTMSITAICAITIQNEFIGLVSRVLFPASPTTRSRTSMVPLHQQEHAAQDQHQVAHRDALAEQAEQVVGEPGQLRPGSAAGRCGDAGHRDAEPARLLAGGDAAAC